ncbi:MAG: uracil-DNA glycosylase [Victivallaceae bacterium]
MSESFFDQLVEAVQREGANGYFSGVAPETLDEFFADPAISKLDSPPTALQKVTASPPAASAPQPNAVTSTVKTELDNLDWKSLRANCIHCTACSRAGNPPIFGWGAAGNQPILFISDEPDWAEQQQGDLRAGESGKLLVKMIDAMQLKHNEVFITYMMKCCCPAAKSLNESDLNCCIGYLKRQIELLRPRVIVGMGSLPLRLVNCSEKISQCRGRWMEYNSIPFMPTFHPGYLARVERAKRDAWNDLKAVMKFLAANPQ